MSVGGNPGFTLSVAGHPHLCVTLTSWWGFSVAHLMIRQRSKHTKLLTFGLFDSIYQSLIDRFIPWIGASWDLGRFNSLSNFAFARRSLTLLERACHLAANCDIPMEDIFFQRRQYVVQPILYHSPTVMGNNASTWDDIPVKLQQLCQLANLQGSFVMVREAVDTQDIWHSIYFKNKLILFGQWNRLGKPMISLSSVCFCNVRLTYTSLPKPFISRFFDIQVRTKYQNESVSQSSIPSFPPYRRLGKWILSESLRLSRWSIRFFWGGVHLGRRQSENCVDEYCAE